MLTCAAFWLAAAEVLRSGRKGPAQAPADAALMGAMT